jgi:hypothetical protein
MVLHCTHTACNQPTASVRNSCKKSAGLACRTPALAPTMLGSTIQLYGNEPPCPTLCDTSHEVPYSETHRESYAARSAASPSRFDTPERALHHGAETSAWV